MKGRPIPWTDDELELIGLNGSKPRKEIIRLLCKAFGAKTYYTVRGIESLCKRNGWKAASDGRFKPGHPGNPKSGCKGPNKTSFKKGDSTNRKEVGARRINKDGFIEIKLAQPNIWEHAQRALWIEHHGEIPKGHVVAFKDGDKMNVTIENLELISRGQLARENKIKGGLQHKHHSITPTVRAMAKLQVALSQATENRS